MASKKRPFLAEEDEDEEEVVVAVVAEEDDDVAVKPPSKKKKKAATRPATKKKKPVKTTDDFLAAIFAPTKLKPNPKPATASTDAMNLATAKRLLTATKKRVAHGDKALGQFMVAMRECARLKTLGALSTPTLKRLGKIVQAVQVVQTATPP